MLADRREFIAKVLLGAGALWLSPLKALAEDPCAVQHPFNPPNKDFSGQCSNCGMARPMWARTWFTFENSAGANEVCSLHCLAEVALKIGEDPKNVKVALYSDPYTMMPAEQVYFVIGSKAKGTMSMTSKLAFATENEATKFAADCGGKVVRFPEALQLAQNGVAKENQMITQKRKQMGKIVEPLDNKDTCLVCGMYPAGYPKHKCQLQTADGTVFHFCSTQCLFEFLKNPKKYAKIQVQPAMIWVVDFASGSWIVAKNAYYVIGSKISGPMGKEAISFDKRQEAEKFAQTNGGRVLKYPEVSIDHILA